MERFPSVPSFAAFIRPAEPSRLWPPSSGLMSGCQQRTILHLKSGKGNGGMRYAGNVTAILCVILLGGCVGQPGAGEAGGAVWHGEAGGHAGGYHRRGFPPWGGSGPLPSGTTWQSDGPIEPLAEAGSEHAEMVVPEEATPDMLFEAAGMPFLVSPYMDVHFLLQGSLRCSPGHVLKGPLAFLTHTVGRKGKGETQPDVATWRVRMLVWIVYTM